MKLAMSLVPSMSSPRAQPVGAHEDQDFDLGRPPRVSTNTSTGAGLPPGAGDREGLSLVPSTRPETGALGETADVFLGRGVVHQHGDLLHPPPGQ